MKKEISLDKINDLLKQQGYISDDQIALLVFLSLKMDKPILVEGPAGVGKTEIAKVLAKALDTDLIRLQCFEGLDFYHAIYEWNYQRQLLHLKADEASKKSLEQKEEDLFSDKFLLKRPLLQAITHHKSPVLLIDEIDRADEEFESFLLEILSDWQITIPEMGTIKADFIPIVILTSNSIRELSEALRRRCLYLYIDYPDIEKEIAIIKEKVPEVDEKITVQITKFMHEVRQLNLEKVPGVAESLDWARALAELHIDHLDKKIVNDTLGIIVKDWKDMRNTQLSLSELMAKTGIVRKVDH